MRIAVIDSSALINLVHLELATKLPLYFNVIYVPRSVQEEVNRKSRFRHRLNKLYRTNFYQRCFCADKYRVRLLTLERLDDGEAEGLVQAQERGADFFIADEKRARTIGTRQGLTPIGTVRVLARLSLEGHAPDARTLVRRLRRDLGFRIDEETLSQAIAAAVEPI
jgi:predicted nucleic acid-binding protein